MSNDTDPKMKKAAHDLSLCREKVRWIVRDMNQFLDKTPIALDPGLDILLQRWKRDMEFVQWTLQANGAKERAKVLADGRPNGPS